MEHRNRRLALLGASALVALALAWPAGAKAPSPGAPPAESSIPGVLPAVDPPAPQPRAGETQIPPAGTPAEDDQPGSPAEAAAALEHLRAVAACVRGRGVAIPHPVSDAAGVRLAWPGGVRPEVESAIVACDVDLASATARAASRGKPHVRHSRRRPAAR
jgi:hypothetical protein